MDSEIKTKINLQGNLINQRKLILNNIKSNKDENKYISKDNNNNNDKYIDLHKEKLIINNIKRLEFNKLLNKISNSNETNREKNNEIIFAIIRHGERADLAGKEIKLNISDPELTNRGIKQAYEAGIRLKEILDLIKPHSKKIALLTSPFSRCIMTAKYLKNGMNLNLPLYIENGLSEFINTQWFKSNPSEFLSYIHRNKFLFDEISNEIIIDKSTQKLPIFPESTNKCQERFTNTFNDILNNYCCKDNNYNNDSNKHIHINGFNVIILVSHFFGIQYLLEKMNIPLETFDIEYCSTFIFRYNKETREFKFENNFYPIEEEIY
jgi:broad specificity phosphatase PhoE